MKVAKVSRRLVIDACVLRASGGEDATFPLSKHCRDILRTTLEVCHRAVVTSAIQAEWKKHQSTFARHWRTAMTARKKILLTDVSPDPGLRSKVDAAATTDRGREAMLNDIHLLEAARAADGIVISCDDTARGHFAAVARRVRTLKAIHWINPGQDPDRARTWLEDGAPREEQHQLGAHNV